MWQAVWRRVREGVVRRRSSLRLRQGRWSPSQDVANTNSWATFCCEIRDLELSKRTTFQPIVARYMSRIDIRGKYRAKTVPARKNGRTAVPVRRPWAGRHLAARLPGHRHGGGLAQQ